MEGGNKSYCRKRRKKKKKSRVWRLKKVLKIITSNFEERREPPVKLK